MYDVRLFLRLCLEVPLLLLTRKCNAGGRISLEPLGCPQDLSWISPVEECQSAKKRDYSSVVSDILLSKNLIEAKHPPPKW